MDLERVTSFRIQLDSERWFYDFEVEVRPHLNLEVEVEQASPWGTAETGRKGETGEKRSASSQLAAVKRLEGRPQRGELAGSSVSGGLRLL